MIKRTCQKQKDREFKAPKDRRRRHALWIFEMMAITAFLLGMTACTADPAGSASDEPTGETSAAGSLTTAIVAEPSATDSTVPETTRSAAATTAAKSTTTTIKQTEQTQSTDTGGHYVQPAGADWNLKLVNQWNPLDKNYSQPLETYSGVNQFDSRAMDKLKALISACGKIRVASLYRTYDKQSELFENEVESVMAQGHNRADAETIAATSVARPGTSEHNLGLAVDFLFDGYSALQESYENTATYAWMMQHCADYGFILRFPKNKQEATGVTFEPWHYRYVGEEAAHEIMSEGITLEEYLQEHGK